MYRLYAFLAVTAIVGTGLAISAQAPSPDWSSADVETLQHFQALVRMDTSDPPGNDQPVAAYL